MGELRTIHPPTEPNVSNVNVVYRKPSLREKAATVAKDTVRSVRRKLAHPGDTLTDIIGRMGSPRSF